MLMGRKEIRYKVFRYLLTIGMIGSLYFFIPRWMPGDPITAMLQESSYLNRTDIQQLRSLYELDQPLGKGFVSYWKRILTLNMGTSILYHQPVSLLVWERMKRTLSISLPSLCMGALIGTLVGAIAGFQKSVWMERGLTRLAFSLYTLPPYLLALLFLYLFVYRWSVFPFPWVGNIDTSSLQFFMAPAICMGTVAGCRFYLVSRGNVREEWGKPYVQFAFARGSSWLEVLVRQVLPVVAIPILTVFALDMGFLLSGSLYIEIVFDLQGMGTLLYDAILSRDYPLLHGILLTFMTVLILMNFLADFLYGYLDPRTRRF